MRAPPTGPAAGELLPEAAAEVSRRAGATLADWLELTKPRIGAFVLLAAAVGALLGAGPGAAPARVLEAALWVTLTAAAAGVLNQVFERDTDARMERTRRRPIPAGRIAPRDALLAATLVAAVAVSALALRFGLLSALLALASLFVYAAVYTPLKRLSTLNTVVGALPGAAPPLLGYAATAGRVEGWGWTLFALLFVWQFPHFMAIAWRYRDDYRRAGLCMLPCLPGGEAIAGRQALVYALALLPVGLLPAVRGEAGPVFALGALALGLAYAAAAAYFAARPGERSARLLVRVSLVHLPLLLTLVLVDPVVRVALSHPIP